LSQILLGNAGETRFGGFASPSSHNQIKTPVETCRCHAPLIRGELSPAPADVGRRADRLADRLTQLFVGPGKLAGTAFGWPQLPILLLRVSSRAGDGWTPPDRPPSGRRSHSAVDEPKNKTLERPEQTGKNCARRNGDCAINPAAEERTAPAGLRVPVRYGLRPVNSEERQAGRCSVDPRFGCDGMGGYQRSNPINNSSVA
jgi:hypothetical protein